ncbi:MAG: chemotaxis protein CheA [Candidatus Woesearchaeota archaeon]
MNTEQFKEAFMSEAQDIIEQLNNDLLALEANSDDKELIDKIFRAFHTLKGNAATLGFENFAQTSHALEDLLDAVRNKKLVLDKKKVEILLTGLDVLVDSLEHLQDSGEDVTDGSSIIHDVKEMLHEDEIPIEPVEDVFPKKNLKKTKASLKRVLYVFDAENPLKNAKVLLLLKEIEQKTKIIGTQPKDPSNGIIDILDVVVEDNGCDMENVSITGVQKIVSLGVEDPIPQEVKDHCTHQEKQAVVKRQQDNIKTVQSVKIDIKRLDKLMNYVGELLINKMRLEELLKQKSYQHMNQVVSHVDKLTREIQDEVMSQRMIPIGRIFNRFPRMVRDLATKEQKQVNLEIEGDDIEFDRTVLDLIGDPLVHLLRNAIDHGVELPDARENVGKDPTATLKITARREKTKAIIMVSDDGAGVDPQKVKVSALKKGIISEQEAQSMNDKQLQNLIFRPKMSTNEVITEVSGRGVGMDVVMDNIKKIGGYVSLTSTPGQGTQIEMVLPLTMAIITALMIEMKEKIYAIPISNIDRIISMHNYEIQMMSNQPVIVLNNKTIPFVSLDSDFRSVLRDTKGMTGIIVDNDVNSYCLAVDKVLMQQQILVKSLDDANVKKTHGVSGATILGDGTVALVIDVQSLINEKDTLK